MSAIPLLKDSTFYDPPADPFPYGWRSVKQTLAEGQEIWVDIPLTAADFLDPQLGDHMPQNNKHGDYSAALFTIFKTRYRLDPTVGVFLDIKMKWGIPGLKEPSPDVAVVFNLKDKEAYRSSFDVLAEGTRPALVIEVVSPQYPGDDTDKVRIYERAGIKEYFIVNPHSAARHPYYEITAYRLGKSGYQLISPDKQERWLSRTTRVRFCLREKRTQLILTDALTGQVLLTPERLEDARQEAEKAQFEAEKARQEAEERLQMEIALRTELEKRLRELEAKLKMDKASL